MGILYEKEIRYLRMADFLTARSQGSNVQVPVSPEKKIKCWTSL